MTVFFMNELTKSYHNLIVSSEGYHELALKTGKQQAANPFLVQGRPGACSCKNREPPGFQAGEFWTATNGDHVFVCKRQFGKYEQIEFKKRIRL
jgi:hypothetical protein